MGTSQSTPDDSTSTMQLGMEGINNKNTHDDTKKKPKKKRDKNSVDYKCRKQKRAWSRCVTNHYEKQFLPGKSLEPEDDCDDLFDSFRECYMRGMLQQRQEKGMPPPKKDSMLHEFMVEEGMVEENESNNA